MKNKIIKFFKDERGLGVVEIGLIILVMIALVIIFKGKASEFINKIFDSTDIDGIKNAFIDTKFNSTYLG
jgi:Flp pilus assembly pilin Flp